MALKRTDIIETSATDIAEDCELAAYLLSDLKHKCLRNLKRLRDVKHNNHPSSIDTTRNLLSHILTQCISLEKKVKTQGDTLQHHVQNEQSIDGNAQKVQSISETIRSLIHAAGAAMTASDWQSPSYDASGYQNAGRQTGRIHATQNDYKRDQHEDASDYERAFCREYIDSPIPYQMHVYATHTGMGAFTTILGYLIGQNHIKDSILVGSSVYFEVKQLLQSLLKNTYHEVDETDMRAVSDAIKKWKPDAIFIDSIGNTPSMTVPHIRNLLNVIGRSSKKEVYCVIDNTTTSVFVQPFSPLFHPSSHVHVIAFESLNKFHQFGLDGVFGGIIYSRGADTIKLFDYRRNMGTNIADSAVMCLPTPNRKLLTKRMKRIERNALVLSRALSEAYLPSDTPIDHIVYPGLTDHPDHRNIHGFAGPFLTIAFRPDKQTMRILKTTAARILTYAKKEKIPLVAGTSFGLPITRIYQTATNTSVTTPFLRISPGTENFLAIQRLSRMLTTCVMTMT